MGKKMERFRQVLNSKPATIMMGAFTGVFVAADTVGANWPPIIEDLWIFFGGLAGAVFGLLFWHMEKELKEIFGKKKEE